MTDATPAVILDRIHAINQTIGGNVKSARYFPESLDSPKLPLLCAIPGQNARSSNHTNQKFSTRDYLILGFVGDFMQGLPTQTAQTNAEALIPLVEACYDQRNRLQLAAGDPGLDNINSADLRLDSGIIDYANSGIATVIWTLTVVSQRTVTLL